MYTFVLAILSDRNCTQRTLTHTQSHTFRHVRRKGHKKPEEKKNRNIGMKTKEPKTWTFAYRGKRCVVLTAMEFRWQIFWCVIFASGFVIPSYFKIAEFLSAYFFFHSRFEFVFVLLSFSLSRFSYIGIRSIKIDLPWQKSVRKCCISLFVWCFRSCIHSAFVVLVSGSFAYAPMCCSHI